jgi:hypothetical protein
LRVALAVLLGACLTGCATAPEWYPIPPQREFIARDVFGAVRFAIAMTDPNVNEHIVADIASAWEGNGWRWTGARPVLRFTLPKIEKLTFFARFTVAGATFVQTGPVTLSFFINDRLLGKVRYAAEGDQRYEKPVPSEWLRLDEPNQVVIEIDPPYVSPGDQTKLGVNLYELGFKQ